MRRSHGRLAVAAAALLGCACGGSGAGGSGAGGGGGATPSPAAGAGGGGTPASVAVTPASWTMYHHDATRSGVDAGSGDLHSARLAWSSAPLDGAVDAEPLMLGEDVVAVTEHDSVYVVDAASGALRWKTSIGEAVPGSSVNPRSADHAACGGRSEYGIMSTPVIDVQRGELFVVGVVRPMQHVLVGLSLRDGAVLSRRTVDAPDMVVSDQQQRAALTLANGVVYVGFGGYNGDCGRYHGYVVGAREDGTGPLAVFETPGTGAAVWAPSGPAVDAAGNLLVTTGNGGSGASDQANSVLRLSAGLQVIGGFTPANSRALSAGDLDLGSLGPALVDGEHVFQAGKEGIGYLLSSTDLGKPGAPVFSARVCASAFGGTAFASPLLYVPCSDGLVALRIEDDRFEVAWHGPKLAAGSPIVAGGLVWCTDQSGPALYGLDPQTGAVVVHLDVGQAAHFATPAAGGGRLVVATLAPRLVALSAG